MARPLIASVLCSALFIFAVGCGDDGNGGGGGEEGPPCGEAMRAPSAGKCTLTYQLTGDFHITDTPLGAGDLSANLEAGVLIVEVPAEAGEPGEGAARVHCFELEQHFVADAAGVVITTEVLASFTEAEGATGTLAEGALVFDTCEYAESNGTTSWSPDGDTAEGPGCLTGYKGVGSVHCDGLAAFCKAGGLELGDNPQDDTWAQPFNTLTFGADYATVAMGGAAAREVGEDGEHPALFKGGEWTHACPFNEAADPPAQRECAAHEAVEIPSRNPSRTWLAFSGTLVETRCDG